VSQSGLHAVEIGNPRHPARCCGDQTFWEDSHHCAMRVSRGPAWHTPCTRIAYRGAAGRLRMAKHVVLHAHDRRRPDRHRGHRCPRGTFRDRGGRRRAAPSAVADTSLGQCPLLTRARRAGNSIHYTHSSTLRTLEEIFGVTPLLGDAANATDLGDLFATFP